MVGYIHTVPAWTKLRPPFIGQALRTVNTESIFVVLAHVPLFTDHVPELCSLSETWARGARWRSTNTMDVQYSTDKCYFL